MRKLVCHLEKALDELQQVEAAVAAVVLQGDSAVRASHLLRAEVSRPASANLPLRLQVPAHTAVSIHPYAKKPHKN